MTNKDLLGYSEVAGPTKNSLSRLLVLYGYNKFAIKDIDLYTVSITIRSWSRLTKQRIDYIRWHQKPAIAIYDIRVITPILGIPIQHEII